MKLLPEPGSTDWSFPFTGHPFNAGHLQYDSGMQNARYERSALRSLKPLWHMGVPPYVDARRGYPLIPGHFVSSMTCRDGLTALSRHGQLVDL